MSEVDIKLPSYHRYFSVIFGEDEKKNLLLLNIKTTLLSILILII
jgi:hypothetical protein